MYTPHMPRRKPAKGPNPQNNPDREISPTEWASLGHLDRAARRRKYEEIAHTASNLKDQMMAMRALEDMDSITAEGLGPKAPLTDKDKISRLSRLMSAIGEPLTKAAFKVAKKYWKEEATWISPTIYDGESVESQVPKGPSPSNPSLE
jgi:hypothetical protein